MYRIIIVDDHEVFRLGLRTVINQNTDAVIVGEAENGKALIDLLESVECDLILLDLSMPEQNGFFVLETIKIKYPAIKCLILSMYTDENRIKKALSYDIAGYVHKEDIAINISKAISEIQSGKNYFSDNIQKFILSNYHKISDSRNIMNQLTKREGEVAELVVAGLTTLEIAEKLHISNHTVQFHRSNILKKLDLKNTVDLVKLMIEENL
jgi:two-component system, NarL family, response regulator NreC